VHLIGFIIRIFHDARSPECQMLGRTKRKWGDDNNSAIEQGVSPKRWYYLSVWGHILENSKIVYLIG